MVAPPLANRKPGSSRSLAVPLPQKKASLRGWSCWNRGGSTPLPGLFSGSPERWSTPSGTQPGTTHRPPRFSGLFTGLGKKRRRAPESCRRRPERAIPACVFSGWPESRAPASEKLSGSPAAPSLGPSARALRSTLVCRSYEFNRRKNVRL